LRILREPRKRIGTQVEKHWVSEIYPRFLFKVVLKGGKTSNEGDVYARNPTTGIYGPVCSNNWIAENVRLIS